MRPMRRRSTPLGHTSAQAAHWMHSASATAPPARRSCTGRLIGHARSHFPQPMQPFGSASMRSCGTRSAEPSFFAQYHERRHPADAVAHGATPQEQIGNEEQRHDAEIDRQSQRAVHRHAARYAVQRVDRRETTGDPCARYDGAHPRHPDHILDARPPPQFRGLAYGGRLKLLQAARRAQPPAPRATQHDSQQELQAEHEHAGSHRPFQGALDDQRR